MCLVPFGIQPPRLGYLIMQVGYSRASSSVTGKNVLRLCLAVAEETCKISAFTGSSNVGRRLFFFFLFAFSCYSLVVHGMQYRSWLNLSIQLMF